MLTSAKSHNDVAEICDVCLILEGCYPFVSGGVSSWVDWLIRSQPETSFRVVALWPLPGTLEARYARPRNLRGIDFLYLQQFGSKPGRSAAARVAIDRLGETLTEFMTFGGETKFAAVIGALDQFDAPGKLEQLFNSPAFWALVQVMYRRDMPNGSFLHYFWAWRALLGGLFSVLEHPLPQAKIYHTVSTGYAGLLAARAKLETGRPAILTEHGIYTNERRIELLMADWVADTIERGHALDDDRVDLRDIWIRTFEGYARTCYEAADEIVTLHAGNQPAQRMLGAAEGKLKIIANGIDVDRFIHIAATPRAGRRPTIALVGRVVAIKDVMTFISAANLLRTTVPQLHALVIGSQDEEPDYHRECVALVQSLGLEHTVEFTGSVDISAYLDRIDVMVLTSLSESQPLVILEAGAAAIPFVATDVGACREMIEGRGGEDPSCGPGGIITHLAAADEIAASCGRLLADETFRCNCGKALQKRVTSHYSATSAAAAYGDLYGRYLGDKSDGAT